MGALKLNSRLKVVDINADFLKEGQYEHIGYYDLLKKKEILFSPKQCEALLAIIKGEDEFVGYGGAAMGGKSMLICWAAVLLAYAYPQTNWGIARHIMADLKKTILFDLEECLKNNNLKEKRDYKFNRELGIITFNNGSKIYLIGLKENIKGQEGQDLGGLQLTGAFVDESGQCDLDRIKILYIRTGRMNNGLYGLKRFIMETFNPSQSHIRHRYWTPFSEKRKVHNYRFIRALPSDNPSQDAKDYVQDIINSGDEENIERFVYGNFDYFQDPEALYSVPAIKSLYLNPKKPEASGCVTADIAMRGSDSFVVCVWFGRVLMDFIDMPKCGGKQIIDLLLSKCEQWEISTLNICYDADGMGQFIGEDGGFIEDAIPFKNASRPAIVKRANMANMKAYCAIQFAKRMQRGDYYLFALLQDEEKKTRLGRELRAVKKLRADDDLRTMGVSNKDDIKKTLSFSPDYWDAIIAREHPALNGGYTGESF